MLVFTYLKEILLSIAGFIAIYLFNRNKTLKIEKKQLEENLGNKNKIINVQNKVIKASNNIKHSNLDDILDKLSDSKRK